MTHDVFISYSSHDQKVADAVCAGLESDSIRCWIAPRDVPPGANYGATIVDALAAAKVVVLIFSSKANSSSQVVREIERGVSHGHAIIPFRVEPAIPSKAMEYFISSCQWLDATAGPLQRHIRTLSTVVRSLIIGYSSQPAETYAPPKGRVFSRKTIVGIVAAVVLIAVLCWLSLNPNVIPYVKWSRKQIGGRMDRSSTGIRAPPHSIAVLPFENLSSDPTNAFFANGIQDEILTRLAKIAAIKVISRTSTRQYASKPPNLEIIGKELGVATLLEGSVQKLGETVRVNVQLIDAATDGHLWAETYDRELSDIFAVETEVAAEIASALRVALSPQEKSRLAAKPTENIKAYALYLKARTKSEATVPALENTRECERMYTQAIALDPSFALAHAALSMEHSFDYQNFDPSDEHKTIARIEAQEALRFQPDLGEGHFAHGSYYYRVEQNYAQALNEYTIAARTLPNDAELARDIGLMSRRQGLWRQALRELERATSLGPRSLSVIDSLAGAYADLKEWDAAVATRQRALAVAMATSPDAVETITDDLAWLEFSRTGSLAAIDAFIADAKGDTTLDRIFIGLLKRDFDAVERTLATAPQAEFELPDNPHTPKGFLQAFVALARGDRRSAKPLLEAALLSAKADVEAAPDSARRHSYLGLVYAYLGREEEAVAEGRKAVELCPESKDALEGPKLSYKLAISYVWAGESDKAIELIERLLATPAAGFGMSELRFWWEFDPVRNQPRFQALLSKPEPRVIYR